MTPLLEFKDHFPDVHHQMLTGFYKATPEQEAEDRAKLDQVLDGLTGFYVICFTNRCGSTFLAHALASEGRIQAAGEQLNFEPVSTQSTKLGLRSYPAYLAHLIERGSARSGIFGVKAGIGQLIGLYNAGVLERVKDKLTLVHITRQDLLAQAVSMYIATRTKRWTSKQEGVDAELLYQPGVLLSTLDGLCRRNAAFKALFELFQLDAVPVQYEKLVDDPGKVVKRVGRHLGLPNLRYVPEKVPIEKQADEVNERLLREWTAAYALGAPRHVRVDDE